MAIIALAAIGGAVATWILSNQGVRAPWSEAPFRLYAELSSGQAVMPGQGQSVQVSGVFVGKLADVELRNGRAILALDLRPEYRDLVHTNATALLRPKTGLKDMLLDLDPGTDRAPLAQEGWTIPVQNTQPDVNVDEILAMLDADTRPYVQLLVGGLAQGLRDRGPSLREVFRRFEPTHRDLAKVTGRLAQRHRALRRIVHSLRLLSEEVAGRDRELAGLISSSARVFRAFASEDRAIADGIERLPAALEDTRSALSRVEGLADELGPTAEVLTPLLQDLQPTLESLAALSAEATPLLRRDVRPFVREARPVARDLPAPASDLATSLPSARRSGVVVNHLLNMLAFNPDGREGVDDPDREEGFLYWLAWGGHIAGALHATGDAHGPLRGLSVSGPCSALAGYADVIGQGDPLLGTVLGGLQGVFTDERVCGGAGAQPAGLRARLDGAPLQQTEAGR